MDPTSPTLFSILPSAARNFSPCPTNSFLLFSTQSRGFPRQKFRPAPIFSSIFHVYFPQITVARGKFSAHSFSFLRFIVGVIFFSSLLLLFFVFFSFPSAGSCDSCSIFVLLELLPLSFASAVAASSSSIAAASSRSTDAPVGLSSPPSELPLLSPSSSATEPSSNHLCPAHGRPTLARAPPAPPVVNTPRHHLLPFACSSHRVSTTVSSDTVIVLTPSVYLFGPSCFVEPFGGHRTATAAHRELLLFAEEIAATNRTSRR